MPYALSITPFVRLSIAHLYACKYRRSTYPKVLYYNHSILNLKYHLSFLSLQIVYC